MTPYTIPTHMTQEYMIASDEVAYHCPCGENHLAPVCAICDEAGHCADIKWHEPTQSRLCEMHREYPDYGG